MKNIYEIWHENIQITFLFQQPKFASTMVHPYMTNRKNHSFDYLGLCKEMSLLFITLPRFVLAFLPRSEWSVLISRLQSPYTVMLEPKKIKPVTVSIPPPLIYLPWNDETRCHIILVFWMLSFKSALSLSSFTFNLLIWGYWYFS